MHGLQTPALLLDLAKVDANSDRLLGHLETVAPEVLHRPHLKTAKSVDVARHVLEGRPAAITVSTLREAEIFAAAGITDILLAVGIVPAKLPRVLALRQQGADLKIVTDNLAMARTIADFSRTHDCALPTLIEIDCDGHRSGVPASDADEIVAIGNLLMQGAVVAGVMTHAGGSYDARSASALAAAATDEVTAINQAASALRDAGLPAPIVSIGSTPTAHHVTNLDGVTEVRAGVYMFYDLVMAGLNICAVDAIALSVLTTVIGHQPDKGWILVDAGWMAMSRDRGTADQAVDQGYGLACNLAGQPYGDLIMTGANQEHGILALRAGAEGSLPDLAVGDQLRILPNHACATAAQHESYHVLDADGQVIANWPRFSGW